MFPKHGGDTIAGDTPPKVIQSCLDQYIQLFKKMISIQFIKKEPSKRKFSPQELF